MVKIEKFEIERWLATHGPSAKYKLADSYPTALSIQELQSLSDNKTEDNHGPLSPSLLSTRLGYGELSGSTKLRSTIAGLYSIKTPSLLPPENVLITPGGSLANCLCFYALCGPGDHVILQYPTYQLSYSVPASLGAEVTLWRAKEDNKWGLDVDELKDLVKPNTKMVVLTNPHNPAGAVIPRSTLEDVIHLARDNSLYVLSDEVYRPLFHSITPGDEEFPPSVLSLGYDKAIVTSSMSKAYSLAGIRVGWIASRGREVIDQALNHRSYTTIAVSQLDQEVAAYALDGACLHNLLQRNIGLAKRNITILETFIEKHRWACEWVRPVAGTVAFVKFSKMGKPVDDLAFCTQLLEKKGVLFAPGSTCFGNHTDFKGYVRIGYAPETETLEAGLTALAEFLDENYEDVPLAGKELPMR